MKNWSLLMTRLDAKSSQSQREEAILNNFHNWTKRKGPLLLHRKGASQIWESIAAGKSIVNPEKGHESEGNPGFGCEPESHFAGPARRSSCARSARNRNSKTCNASNVERVCSFSTSATFAAIPFPDHLSARWVVKINTSLSNSYQNSPTATS